MMMMMNVFHFTLTHICQPTPLVPVGIQIPVNSWDHRLKKKIEKYGGQGSVTDQGKCGGG
jgi:hypothetical protein